MPSSNEAKLLIRRIKSLLDNKMEQPLPPGGVCNLGAMNLACYVDERGRLMEKELAEDTAVAIRFLDNVIDATPYFTDLNREMQKEGTRRTGLGLMGLADMLIKMGVRYGSDESLDVIERVCRLMRDSAYRMSVDLAREKGAFPRFECDKFLQGHHIKDLPEDIRQGIAEHGIRNGVLLTVAPTGSTSLMAGVSSGIEPVFAFEMHRSDRLGHHTIYHPLAQEWRDEHPGEDLPAYFVCARDLEPADHVRVQAMVQRYVDSSISKTTNGPHHYTVDQVRALYTQAFDSGCKGITFYREGSRDAVLTAAQRDEPPAEPPAQSSDVGLRPDMARQLQVWQERAAQAERQVVVLEARERALREQVAALSWAQDLPSHVAQSTLAALPAELAGFTASMRVPEGSLHVTVNHDTSGPIEVFVNVGRAGSDLAALAEALGRLISLTLRLPSTMSQTERLHHVALQLRGIGGSSSMGFGSGRTLSMADGLAHLLLKYLDHHTPARAPRSLPTLLPTPAPQQMPLLVTSPAAPAPNGKTPPSRTGNLCPSCGSTGSYVYEEGCRKCYSCGYAAC